MVLSVCNGLEKHGASLQETSWPVLQIRGLTFAWFIFIIFTLIC